MVGHTVGVDALGDPQKSEENPVFIEKKSRSIPSLHHRGRVSGAKTGYVFAPRLYPSPPKCGRRFGFAENGDSRVSYFTASKGAYDILRMNTEGRRKEFGCYF